MSVFTRARFFIPILSGALTVLFVLPSAGQPADRWLFSGEWKDEWAVTDYSRPGEVVFTDTAVVLHAGDPMTGITWTGEYPDTNYEVAFEAQRVDGRDFFCGLTFPVGNSPCTLILGGWGGTVAGLSSVDGLDASENETRTSLEFENGRWYRILLRVTDRSITAFVDDERIVDLETEGRRFSVRPEVSRSRPLGIATWRTTGALRNLHIRTLEPTH